MVPSLAVQQPGVGVVSADNLNTFVQGGALLADLQSFVGTQNQTVFAIGLAAIADGHQGMFYWNSSWTGTPDNVSTIQPSSMTQGAWVRLSGS